MEKFNLDQPKKDDEIIKNAMKEANIGDIEDKSNILTKEELKALNKEIFKEINPKNKRLDLFKRNLRVEIDFLENEILKLKKKENTDLNKNLIKSYKEKIVTKKFWMEKVMSFFKGHEDELIRIKSKDN